MRVPRPQGAVIALVASIALSSPAAATPRFTWDGGPPWRREFFRPIASADSVTGPMGACRPLPASAPQGELDLSDVDGGGAARWANHEGERAPDGAHAAAEAGGRLTGLGPLSIRVRPRLAISEEVSRVVWLEALATVRAGCAALDAGRTRLWLGPARRGSLLLSNNAHPLDLLHLRAGGGTSNDLPVLRHLRALEGGLAVASLREEDRDFPNPNLAAAHMAVFWSAWLEVDVTRTALFGGEGREVEVGWETIRDLILAHGENHVDASKNLSDQLAAIAFVVRPGVLVAALRGREQPSSPRLPQRMDGADGLWAYYEYAGEDNLKGIFPGSPGVSLGVTGKNGDWEGAAELAVNRKRAGAWYVHPTYSSGYTYRGEILGHHMGTDAQILSAEAAFPLPASRGGRLAVERLESGYLTLPRPARTWAVAGAVERIASRRRCEIGADVVARWQDHEAPGVSEPLERFRVSVRVSVRP